MIDKNGLSTGKETRLIVEELENELLLNFRKQFVAKNDKPIELVDWDKWRASQMLKFDKFKRENKKIVKKYMREVSESIVKDFEQSYRHGGKQVEKFATKVKKKGVELKSKGITPTFNKNPRVILQLKQMQESLNNAYTGAMNSIETQFLQTVRNADKMPMVKTLFQAVDMANKDLIQSGIVGKVTSNNRRLNIANHIEMTTVEGSQEIMFIGKAMKSEDLGIHTVYISKHESTCPLCTPWQGKVLIDDVYQNGKPDGKHQLLSTAVKAGLFHVNCRDNAVPFIEGVDVIPDFEKRSLDHMSKREQHALYKHEQQLRYNERQIRQWKRAEAMSLSEEQSTKAREKIRLYQAKNRQLVSQTDGLYRNYWREKPGFTVPKDVRWANLKYDLKVFD